MNKNTFSLSCYHTRLAYFCNKRTLWFSSLLGLGLLTSLLSLYVPYLGVQFSLRSLPVFFIGLLFGPMIGFTSGIGIDILGFCINGGNYPFFLLFSMQCGMYGLAGGFLMRWMGLFKANKVGALVGVISYQVIANILISCVFGMLFIYMYHQNFGELGFVPNYYIMLSARLIKESFKIPIMTLFVYVWYLKTYLTLKF